MNAPSPAPVLDLKALDVDGLVDKFVQLRDRLKLADDAHKQRCAPARELLAHMEGELMERLKAVGGEKIGTKHGTVYRTSRKSATLADADAFRRFVIGGEHWDLCDWRANATAIAGFLEEHNALPTGVNYSVTYTVGVRRSNSKE